MFASSPIKCFLCPTVGRGVSCNTPLLAADIGWREQKNLFKREQMNYFTKIIKQVNTTASLNNIDLPIIGSFVRNIFYRISQI